MPDRQKHRLWKKLHHLCPVFLATRLKLRAPKAFYTKCFLRLLLAKLYICDRSTVDDHIRTIDLSKIKNRLFL